MIIENLKKEDIESYKELIDESFDGSNEIDFYKKYNPKSNNYEIIVAKENNRIIGSITFYKIELFTFSFQPVLEIFNVCVLKDYRGKKIVKKIFEYIFDFAKENGYRSVNLTCLDTAVDARALYESIGMKKTNSIKYNIDL